MISFLTFTLRRRIFSRYTSKQRIKCDKNFGESLNKMYILYVYVYMTLILVIIRIVEESTSNISADTSSFGSSNIFLPFFMHPSIRHTSLNKDILLDETSFISWTNSFVSSFPSPFSTSQHSHFLFIFKYRPFNLFLRVMPINKFLRSNKRCY